MLTISRDLSWPDLSQHIPARQQPLVITRCLIITHYLNKLTSKFNWELQGQWILFIILIHNTIRYNLIQATHLLFQSLLSSFHSLVNLFPWIFPSLLVSVPIFFYFSWAFSSSSKNIPCISLLKKYMSFISLSHK